MITSFGPFPPDSRLIVSHIYKLPHVRLLQVKLQIHCNMLASRSILLFSSLGALMVAAQNGTHPPLPATGQTTLKPFAPATNTSSFVTARDGKLYLDGLDYTFAGFNNVGHAVRAKLMNSRNSSGQAILKSKTSSGRLPPSLVP